MCLGKRHFSFFNFGPVTMCWRGGGAVSLLVDSVCPVSPHSCATSLFSVSYMESARWLFVYQKSLLMVILLLAFIFVYHDYYYDCFYCCCCYYSGQRWHQIEQGDKWVIESRTVRSVFLKVSFTGEVEQFLFVCFSSPLRCSWCASTFFKPPHERTSELKV